MTAATDVKRLFKKNSFFTVGGKQRTFVYGRFMFMIENTQKQSGLSVRNDCPSSPASFPPFNPLSPPVTVNVSCISASMRI